MSFRIKKTHATLNNKLQQKDEKSSIFVMPEEKGYELYLSRTEQTKGKNRPQNSSNNGIAIRTVTGAIADYY